MPRKKAKPPGEKLTSVEEITFDIVNMDDWFKALEAILLRENAVIHPDDVPSLMKVIKRKLKK